MRPKPAQKESARKIIILIFKLLAIIIIVNLFSKYKPLIILAVFELLDFMKNIIKQSVPYMPIDLVFIFGITASYYYNPWFGVIIFFLGVVNRAIMSNIEFRHMSKGVRHIPLFFAASFLGAFPFFNAAFALLVLNYVLKFLLKIATYQTIFEKSHYNTVNFCMATLFFYLLSMIYFYFPFLA